MNTTPLLTRLSPAKGMTTAVSTFGEPTTTPVAMIHCWLAAVKVRLSALVERVGMAHDLRFGRRVDGTIRISAPSAYELTPLRFEFGTLRSARFQPPGASKTMAFLADSLGRVKPSATIAVTNKAAELKAAGMRRHRPGRRRARFRHARFRQGSGDRGDPRAARPNTPTSTAPPSCKTADRRPSSSATTASTTSRPDHRQRRRQADHVQRAGGDARSRATR